MTRPVRALIDLQALQSNFHQARKAASESRIMAIVKADGYGHGITRVATGLSAADAFGVASLEEAVVLRDAGIRQPILLLEGFFEPDELAIVCDFEIDTVVHHAGQLEILERARNPKPLSVWLKIDTGMHRLGFTTAEVAAVVDRLHACPNVVKPIRFLSHLACADNRESDRTQVQLDGFLRATGQLPGERSLANSAGVLAWPDTHLDWVRPGIMLYGASPLQGVSARELGLRPVMTLTSRLIAKKNCHRGDAVGYGGAWVCPRDMPIGVVAIGYGDGYPRHAPNGTPVLVNGQQVGLVGRVSMDMICVDLSSQPEANVGDPVQLWGPGLSVDTVAGHAGTIAYELLCGVTGRVAVEIIKSA